MRRARSVDAFVAAGIPRRAHFAHDVAWLAKPYPDTWLQLERRGMSEATVEVGRAGQLNLYAHDLQDLPRELFTDPAVNWHRQQMGRAGLIATAGLYRADPHRLFVTLLQSDVCQQLFRHAALRAVCGSRVDNRFGGWPAMLVNAVLDLAAERGVAEVFIPTSRQILAGIKRPVDPAFFERLYDGPGQRYDARLMRVGPAEYWQISIEQHRSRIVSLEAVAGAPRRSAAGPTICLFHDIEADADTAVSPAECRRSLARMLAVESRRGIQATYNIVGTLFGEARDAVAAAGQAIGFHTYDHAPGGTGQLGRVRELDLQVRGYRPARSELTPELSDYRLAYHNFEWLLCSALVLGFDDCRVEHGIAKIPVHLDDYLLHSGELDYPAWFARLRRLLATRRFVAVGLHDCYAGHWLDRYDELLDTLAVGRLVTCDALADELFLASDESADPPPSETDHTAVDFSMSSAPNV